jgi:ABC-type nitrate/sulfonate/bicarbonate transport system substrate-binding protein
MRLIVLFAIAWLVPAAAADVVRVNTFPNAKALPFYAGVAKGIFAKHGLDVRVDFTENSQKQRAGLAAGTFDIAHSAVDNAVAMVEDAKQDVVIVTGGDNGMNEFYAQPEIKSLADLRGRTLVVDAPNTAYALLAKKILLKEGLHEGRDYTVRPVGRGELRLKAMAESKENSAAILNLPFTIQAEQMGLKSFGNPVELLGPYQAGGAFLLRSWARAHDALLVRYIAAYVDALRWSLDAAHAEDSIGLLMERLHISRDIAERTYRALGDPARGFTPDAAFDREGFRNMLALRTEIEGGQPGAPEKYVDLSYYERALAELKRAAPPTK